MEGLLECANWAPTHGRTEPWRFVVLGRAAQEQFMDLSLQARRPAGAVPSQCCCHETPACVGAQPTAPLSASIVAAECSCSREGMVGCQAQGLPVWLVVLCLTLCQLPPHQAA